MRTSTRHNVAEQTVPFLVVILFYLRHVMFIVRAIGKVSGVESRTLQITLDHFTYWISLSLRPKTETKRRKFGLSPEFRLTTHRSAADSIGLTADSMMSSLTSSLISPYFFV